MKFKFNKSTLINAKLKNILVCFLFLFPSFKDPKISLQNNFTFKKPSFYHNNSTINQAAF